MKALKKVLVIAVCAALTLTAMPQAKAEAATALATYSFDNTDGMTDPGFGALPSITTDSERGSVLQFADGESPEYHTESGNAKGVHMCEIVGGTPSSYEIPNPYAGGSYTEMTYAFWVKSTDPNASTTGAGLLGWVSPEMTSDHPDARAEAKTQEEIGWYEEGVYVFGTSMALVDLMGTAEIPMLNFAGLYHNWYCYWSETVDLADGAWHYVMVTTDSSCANTKVYVDGVDLFTDGGRSDMGKRWNHGEKDATNKANTLEPTLMEIITNAGTKLYIGQTGSNPTMSSVYLDELTFYDSMVTDAEALSMYNDAKAASVTGTGSVANESTDQNASNTDTSADTNNGNTQQTGSTTDKTNNTKKTTTTPNLPQTGVMSTTALVGIGVAVIGAGSVLLKKKEK